MRLRGALAGFMPDCGYPTRSEELPLKIKRLALFIAIGLVAGACTQTPPGSTPPDGSGNQQPGVTGGQKAEWEGIVRLEEEAKAIVKANGCTADDQCRTAPVGSRGCGGPRYYLVYCARSTDSVALFRKLDEVAAAERAYNAKYQVVSTCEFRMPPTVGLNGEACAAK